MNTIVKILKKAHSVLCEIFLLPVLAYRKFISPLKSTPTCRFKPTCSTYALTAVREWGIVVGFCLTVCRIVRCNPFSRGGYDPVPKRRDFFEKIKNVFHKIGKKRGK